MSSVGLSVTVLIIAPPQPPWDPVVPWMIPPGHHFLSFEARGAMPPWGSRRFVRFPATFRALSKGGLRAAEEIKTGAGEQPKRRQGYAQHNVGNHNTYPAVARARRPRGHGARADRPPRGHPHAHPRHGRRVRLHHHVSCLL